MEPEIGKSYLYQGQPVTVIDRWEIDPGGVRSEWDSYESPLGQAKSWCRIKVRHDDGREVVMDGHFWFAKVEAVPDE